MPFNHLILCCPLLLLTSIFPTIRVCWEWVSSSPQVRPLQVFLKSYAIKRHLLIGRKALTNIESMLKRRDITLLTNVRLVKATVFPVVIYGCDIWMDHIEGWVPKNWCFWTVVLEKTLESPSDCKIKTINPKGNQPWILIGRTDAEAEAPILWPPDVKNWLTGKDRDAGKHWRQKKGTTEDKMVG